MAKLKVKVEQDAWDEAGTDSVEPPKPGVYDCKVLEINTGFSKGEDNKPDKDKPRIEVIYQIVDEKAKTRGNDGGSAYGARLWQYITFGDNVQWKLAGFLKAFGIPFKKVGKSLEFDLDTAAIAENVTDVNSRTMKAGPKKATGHEGKPCRVKVKPDSNQTGEYRAGVGAVLPPKEDSDDDDAFGESDGESLGDDETIEDAADENMADDFQEEDTDGDDSGYTEDDLKAMTSAELKEVVAAFNEAGHELVIKGLKKSEVIALILSAQEAADEGDDEMVDDDMVEDDSAESEAYTQESLSAMEPSQIKEVCKAFDINFGGKKKSQIIAEILAKQASDEGDENDNPF